MVTRPIHLHSAAPTSKQPVRSSSSDEERPQLTAHRLLAEHFNLIDENSSEDEALEACFSLRKAISELKKREKDDLVHLSQPDTEDRERVQFADGSAIAFDGVIAGLGAHQSRVNAIQQRYCHTLDLYDIRFACPTAPTGTFSTHLKRLDPWPGEDDSAPNQANELLTEYEEDRDLIDQAIAAYDVELERSLDGRYIRIRFEDGSALIYQGAKYSLGVHESKLDDAGKRYTPKANPEDDVRYMMFGANSIFSIDDTFPDPDAQVDIPEPESSKPEASEPEVPELEIPEPEAAGSGNAVVVVDDKIPSGVSRTV